MRIHTFRQLTLFSAIGMLLFTGCKKDKDKMTAIPPAKVTVELIGNNDFSDGAPRSFSGTVSSETSTTVSFSASGTIQSLNIEEGQKVRKGQLLGKIEASDYENAYNIANSQLAEAQDAYQRLKKLHDANALPAIKWVEIQEKLKQAENASQLAGRALSDAVLYSPVSGTVSKKFATVGQNVIQGEPIYQIVSTDDLTIDIPVSENQIGGFSEGQKAEVKLENPTLPTLEGKVTQKSVVADPLTRSYMVKVGIPSEGGKVLPGMIGEVIFPDNNQAKDSIQEIILPAQSVQLAADNSTFVWVVKNGKAERKFVKADMLVANGVIIEEGLVRGDSVIIEGMRKVGTGSPVVPVNK